MGERQTSIFLGQVSRKELEESDASAWFKPSYQAMPLPDLKKTGNLRALLSRPNIEIFSFIGTWCGDTKDLLPPFYRILDEAGFAPEKLKTIALDQSKKGHALAEIFQIEKVPTFILLINKKELGRIVETPRVSLIDDLLKILAN